MGHVAYAASAIWLIWHWCFVTCMGFLDIVVETAQLETTGHGNHAFEAWIIYIDSIRDNFINSMKYICLLMSEYDHTAYSCLTILLLYQ